MLSETHLAAAHTGVLVAGDAAGVGSRRPAVGFAAVAVAVNKGGVVTGTAARLAVERSGALVGAGDRGRGRSVVIGFDVIRTSSMTLIDEVIKDAIRRSLI